MPFAISRVVRLVVAAAAVIGCTACTAPGLILTATGIATDTSMTWDIVKHVHGKLTEDDPTPCAMLNSVQRALNPRCEYAAGSIRVADLKTSGLQSCPLVIATSDPRLWRALPELLAKGALPGACPDSPLQYLAATDPCPDFVAASVEQRAALVTLAETDARAVRHDVFRMFGCPNARAAGLDSVLVHWLDRGALDPRKLSFNPLGAAHPDLLVTRFGHELEVAGFSADKALDNYDGTLPSSFEEALRSSHWAALEWWLYRLPQLANRAPPTRGGQLSWVPLQRVITPGWVRHPESQRELVVFLMRHGANPYQKLPFDSGKTVISYASALKSPLIDVLDPRPPPLPVHTKVAEVRAPATAAQSPR
ncbi:MAG: hypothetical protein M3Z16_12640 [Pseudomonadota bacterium]|nr:hypothetical protein [Pseudomonadota bacterium]